MWGTDGFVQTGTPDIGNPLDAVPAAARLLCASGGGSSATLSGAIFSYNHATWYVNEVLALAGEDAQNNSWPSGRQAGTRGDRRRRVPARQVAALATPQAAANAYPARGP